MLIISGHYDGGHEFFSEHVEASEFLPVAEMERVSCSGSCPGLFSRLKEVYLFGCNTLNPEAQAQRSANAVSTLVQGGLPRAEAERLVRSVNARYGESSRDRMRLVFKDVPVIYGFSSVAPLGPTAAGILNRYFQTAGTSEIATGRPSARLLGQFAAHSLTVTRGMTDADPHAGVRRDVCQFADDRILDCAEDRFRSPAPATADAGSADVHGPDRSIRRGLDEGERQDRDDRDGAGGDRAGRRRRARAISRLRGTRTRRRCACRCWISRAISDGSPPRSTGGTGQAAGRIPRARRRSAPQKSTSHARSIRRGTVRRPLRGRRAHRAAPTTSRMPPSAHVSEATKAARARSRRW